MISFLGRMEGPIGKTEEQVSWASRDSQHSRSPTTSFSSGAGRSQLSEAIPEEEDESPGGEDKGKGKGKASLMFSPSEHRLAEDSPKPFTPGEQQHSESGEGKGSGSSPLSGPGQGHSRAENTRLGPLARPRPPILPMDHHHISAPSELGRPHRRITDPTTTETPTSVGTADQIRPQQPPIELDRQAPLRAIREQQRRGPNTDPPIEDENRVKRKDTVQPLLVDQSRDRVPSMHKSLLETLKANEPASFRSVPLPNRPIQDSISPLASREGDAPQWGTPFKVRWIKVAKLPFHRTRHLRNPWNHEREVKVSRDGTELEPGVGQALLDEWDKLDQPPSEVGPETAAPPPGPASPTNVLGRRSGHLRRPQPQPQSQDPKSR